MGKRGEYEVLRRNESRSRPGNYYEVRRGGDDTLYCTCPRWRFNQGKKGCTHLDAYISESKQVKRGRQEDVRLESLHRGDVIEVVDNSGKGRVYLMKFIKLDTDRYGKVVAVGNELDQDRTSLRGEKEAYQKQVVRILVRTRGE